MSKTNQTFLRLSTGVFEFLAVLTSCSHAAVSVWRYLRLAEIISVTDSEVQLSNQSLWSSQWNRRFTLDSGSSDWVGEHKACDRQEQKFCSLTLFSALQFQKIKNIFSLLWLRFCSLCFILF